MSPLGSIFYEFNLPNATTWFYFSLLLAIALFFKFSRLLSVRNWDVLTVFLLVPGLLLLQEARHQQPVPVHSTPLAATQLFAGTTQAILLQGSGAVNLGTLLSPSFPGYEPSPPLLWFGYLWLVLGSAYFLIRCLLDLVLVRRPALHPNLNLAGLAWLAGALLVCLFAVAIRKPQELPETVGKRSAAVNETQRRAEVLVQQEIGEGFLEGMSASFWVERGLAMLCHLAILVGLVFIGCRHFQDATAGMAAATFYLLLPYTAYHVEQIHHVWPTALLIWAVAAYRVPMLAGLLLGAAAGTVYFPVLLFPVWLSFYWRRGAGRFALAFCFGASLCLAIVASILWMDGELAHSLHSALALTDWQPWRQPSPEAQGVWTGIAYAWVYRMPVFIAYVAFLLTTLFWPAPKNLAHVLALSAALLVGIQFWYADEGGVYVLWYLPLLLLLVFRPNVADRQPPSITPDTDWLVRLRQQGIRSAARLLGWPEPVAPVS